LLSLPARKLIPSLPMTSPNPTASARSSADWSHELPECARIVLARMNTALTLCEAKTELARRLLERRRAWEARGRG
jgi:hypothetical protein